MGKVIHKKVALWIFLSLLFFRKFSLLFKKVFWIRFTTPSGYQFHDFFGFWHKNPYLSILGGQTWKLHLAKVVALEILIQNQLSKMLDLIWVHFVKHKIWYFFEENFRSKVNKIARSNLLLYEPVVWWAIITMTTVSIQHFMLDYTFRQLFGTKLSFKAPTMQWSPQK